VLDAAFGHFSTGGEHGSFAGEVPDASCAERTEWGMFRLRNPHPNVEKRDVRMGHPASGQPVGSTIGSGKDSESAGETGPLWFRSAARLADGDPWPSP